MTERTEEHSVEIERKFLIGRIPGHIYSRCQLDHITQGYLAVSDDAEVRLRIRQSGSALLPTVERRPQAAQYTLEIKSGGSAGKALCRRELSVELTADQFEVLDGLCTGVVDKARMHLLPEDDSGEKWTIDVYTGDLDGLIVAEVEFLSDKHAAEFDPPDWFGMEVTDNRNFRTSAFACDPKKRELVLNYACDVRLTEAREELAANTLSAMEE